VLKMENGNCLIDDGNDVTVAEVASDASAAAAAASDDIHPGSSELLKVRCHAVLLFIE